MSEKKTAYKQILKTLITLSIPTIAEEILSTMLQYVDTAMVGHLGEHATAAVSVTTTVTWLVHSLPGAISVAVLAMIAKEMGRGDNKKIKEISKQTLLVTVVCGVVMTVLSLICSPFIPIWMGAEPAIRRDASVYFAIISIPLVFRTASSVLAAAIRATQDTKTPMFISMGANVMNVVLNYVFIYRFDMGVTGAATASAIAYTAGGAMMFFAYRKNKLLYWGYDSFRIEKSIIKEGIGISLPVLGTNFVSCFGYVVFAALVSGMGTTIFAAHSIAVTAETIFYIPGYGLRTAASALIGVSYGENNKKKFEMVSGLSIALTVLMMCVNGFILYCAAYPLMCLFTNSTRVATLGAEMLKLVAFSEPFFGLMIVMEGIYYGLGRTKYAFFVESFCMWGIRILAAVVCVKLLAGNLTMVWYCMIADNVCKAVLFVIPMLSKSTVTGIFNRS